MSSSSCSDPDFCRGGCCRSFFGTDFCDVESNCVAAPTWIIALVPALLGVAAIVLVVMVCIRLRNRKVVEVFDQYGNAGDRNNLQGQESERNFETDRPLKRT